ncbi:MAG: four helix bundle protein [Thermoleophilaceae bacterium]
MASNFRELRAYQLSRALSNEMHAAMEDWSSFDRWSVGIQLLRAVDSIGANIAEGCGRWHNPDERRFLHMARGSLYEAEHWMLRAIDRGLLPDASLGRLSELAKPLNGLIRAHGRP